MTSSAAKSGPTFTSTPAAAAPAQSPAQSPAAAGATATGDARTRADVLRTVKYLMLFRVGLATLLLASSVIGVLSRACAGADCGARVLERLDGWASPFARFG